MDKRALFGGSIHSRYLVTIQSLQWISERDIGRACRYPGLIENFPYCPGATRAGISIAQSIAVRSGFHEIENTMFAGILAGRKRGPSWRRDRRQDRFKLPMCAFSHQSSQIGHKAFCDPRFGKIPGCRVKAYDHDFRSFHDSPLLLACRSAEEESGATASW